jgi:hypothetical protein
VYGAAIPQGDQARSTERRSEKVDELLEVAKAYVIKRYDDPDVVRARYRVNDSGGQLQCRRWRFSRLRRENEALLMIIGQLMYRAELLSQYNLLSAPLNCT